MTTAGEAMVARLADAGVRRFYTVPGESFLEILDAVDRHRDLQLISTRHESGASFMADADAKLAGGPAVAMATRGPGAANLSIGVHTAHQDSTPMIVLLGDVESPLSYRGAFQEVNLAAFYAPITKLSLAATRSDRMPELIDHALRVATSGRPGPVMISMPADLLAGEAQDAPAIGHARQPPRPRPSREELEGIARMLETADHPVIIAGGGARPARDELVQVAERYGTGVYAAFRRQDVFPNDHGLYLGHLGVNPPEETLEDLKQADAVLVVGCRLNQMTTLQYTLPTSAARVIQIDLEPSAHSSVPTAVEVVGDARNALHDLLDRHATTPDRNWNSGHARFLDSVAVGPSRATTGVDPAHVISAMASAFPDDTVITSDAGNFSGFLYQHWLFRHPNTQAAPTNGAMGYAVPGAVGAKLARPRQRVVAVVGDGGFLMTGQEIETAVRYGIPITVVMMRNGLYGTIALHQARRYGRTAGCDIGDFDGAAYARSMGAQGISVSQPSELGDAFAAAASSESVTVLDVSIDPDLISPTARLSDVLT